MLSVNEVFEAVVVRWDSSNEDHVFVHIEGADPSAELELIALDPLPDVKPHSHVIVFVCDADEPIPKARLYPAERLKINCADNKPQQEPLQDLESPKGKFIRLESDNCLQFVRDDPVEFYAIRSVQYQSDVQQKVIDPCNASLDAAPALTSVSVGDVVAYKDSVTHTWSRARVVSVDTNSGSVSVRNLDYGHPSEPSLQSVRSLPPTLGLDVVRPAADRCRLRYEYADREAVRDKVWDFMSSLHEPHVMYWSEQPGGWWLVDMMAKRRTGLETTNNVAYSLIQNRLLRSAYVSHEEKTFPQAGETDILVGFKDVHPPLNKITKVRVQSVDERGRSWVTKSDQFQQMERNIQLIYKSPIRLHSRIDDDCVKPGAMCIVQVTLRNGNRMFARCTVIQKPKDQKCLAATLFAIDYGIQLVEKLSKIFCVVDSDFIMRTPALGFSCVPSVNTLGDLAKLESLVHRTFYGVFGSAYSDSDDDDLFDFVYPLALFHFSPNDAVVAKPVFERISVPFPQKLPCDEQKYYKVTMLDEEPTANDFAVELENDIESFLAFCLELADLKKKSIKQDDIEIGDLVLVKTNAWGVRARVLQMQRIEDTVAVCVELIDFANRQLTFSLPEVYVLPLSFHAPACHTIRCSLPCQHGTELASNIFAKLQGEFAIRPESFDNNTGVHTVNLYLNLSCSGWVDVNLLLLHLCQPQLYASQLLAIKTKATRTVPSIEQHFPEPDDVQIPYNEPIPVHVQHVESPYAIYVMPDDWKPLERCVQALLNAHMESDQKRPMISSDIALGCCCLAEYFGYYYRAEVVNIDWASQNVSWLRVYYVDYGNEARIELSGPDAEQIYKCPSYLYALHKLVLPSALEVVPDRFHNDLTKNIWTEQESRMFSNPLKEELETVVVRLSPPKRGVYGLEFCDPKWTKDLKAVPGTIAPVAGSPMCDKVGARFEGFLHSSDSDSPGSFGVVGGPAILYYNMILPHLTESFRPIRVAEKELIEGLQCVVGYESVYYRAVVRKIDRLEHSCFVHFVDYGNEMDVKFWQVFHTSAELMRILSPLYIKCRLASFEKNTKWTEECTDWFFDRVDTERKMKFVAREISHDNMSPTVVSLYVNEKRIEQEIRDLFGKKDEPSTF